MLATVATVFVPIILKSTIVWLLAGVFAAAIAVLLLHEKLK